MILDGNLQNTSRDYWHLIKLLIWNTSYISDETKILHKMNINIINAHVDPTPKTNHNI